MGFVPRDDQSEFEVVVTAPEGYTLERTDQTLKELEARLWKLRGTQHIFTNTGEVAGGRAVKGEGNVTRGTIYVRLEDLEERARRKYTQFDVQNDARKILEDYPDLRCSVNDVSQFQGGSRSQTFQVNLSGPDLAKLSEYADRLVAELKKEGGIADLDTTLSLRKPEVQVAIDRERASDFGIPVGTIADSLRILVGGRPVSKFKEGDEQYDVWLRARPSDRDSAQERRQPPAPLDQGGLVELGNMAKLFESRGPTEIERYGRQRIVTVLGNPESIQLGDAVDRAEAILKKMNLPPEYGFVLSGQAKAMAETGKYFLIAFGLSFLFMYLILAAQFESWSQPVAIMMALPVTIPFGLLSLVLFNSPMDIYAMFGLFMLVGIVKKNGILQVDATNQLRAKGMTRTRRSSRPTTRGSGRS